MRSSAFAAFASITKTTVTCSDCFDDCSQHKGTGVVSWFSSRTLQLTLLVCGTEKKQTDHDHWFDFSTSSMNHPGLRSLTPAAVSVGWNSCQGYLQTDVQRRTGSPPVAAVKFEPVKSCQINYGVVQDPGNDFALEESCPWKWNCWIVWLDRQTTVTLLTHLLPGGSCELSWPEKVYFN